MSDPVVGGRTPVAVSAAALSPQCRSAPEKLRERKKGRERRKVTENERESKNERSRKSERRKESDRENGAQSLVQLSCQTDERAQGSVPLLHRHS
jgi:hypothetical protein